MKRRAVLIGVDNYAEDSGVVCLNAAVKDAKRIRHFLHLVRGHAEFEMAEPYGLVCDPTRQEALRAIDAARDGLSAGDLLFVYLAGHGATDSVTRQMLFLCRDAHGRRLAQRLRSRNGGEDAARHLPGVISLADLEGSIGSGPFNCVLICDTCRAEIDDQWQSRSPGIEMVEIAETGQAPRVFLPARPGNVSGTFVRLFSCRERQYAYENWKDGGGLYTFSLCMAMNDRWRTDRYVAFDTALSQSVTRYMQAISKGMSRQSPDKHVTPDAAELVLCDRRHEMRVRQTGSMETAVLDAEADQAWTEPEVKVSIGRFEFPTLPKEVPAATRDIPERIRQLEQQEYGIEEVVEQLENETHKALVPALEHIQDAREYCEEMREMAVLNRPVGWDERTCTSYETGEALDHVADPVELLQRIPPAEREADVADYFTWVIRAHQARSVHEELNRQYESELTREKRKLQEQLNSVRTARRAAQEEDLECVVREFLENAGQVDQFPLPQWNEQFRLLRERRYDWSYEECLDRALYVFHRQRYVRLHASFSAPDERLPFLETCARHGVVEAQKELAGELEWRVREAEAFHWMEEAAETGDAEALNVLGIWHEQGKGVAQNPTAAVQCYRRAADKEYPQAQYRLYQILRWGDFGQPANPVEARRLLEAAAAKGHAPAMRELAACLRREGQYGPAVTVLRRLRQSAKAEGRMALVPWSMELRLRLLMIGQALNGRLSRAMPRRQPPSGM